MKIQIIGKDYQHVDPFFIITNSFKTLPVSMIALPLTFLVNAACQYGSLRARVLVKVKLAVNSHVTSMEGNRNVYQANERKTKGKRWLLCNCLLESDCCNRIKMLCFLYRLTNF